MVYTDMTKEQQRQCDEYALGIIANRLEIITQELDNEYTRQLTSGAALDEHDEAIYRAYEFFRTLNEYNPMKKGWYLKDLYESFEL